MTAISRDVEMAQQSKFLKVILVTSLSVWLMLLLTLFLPTTGLLTRSPPGNADQTLLNLFLGSAGVASAACFVIGMKELEVRSVAARLLRNAHSGLSAMTRRRQIEYQSQVRGLAAEPPRLGLQVEVKRRRAIPMHEWKWRHEQYWIKGRLLSIFRDIKTGRFIKNPL